VSKNVDNVMMLHSNIFFNFAVYLQHYDWPAS